MTRNDWRAVGIILPVIALLLIVALSGDDSSSTDSNSPTERARASVTEQQARAPTQSYEAPSTRQARRCSLAGDRIHQSITEALDGYQVKLGPAYAVKSGAHERANFVAARITGPSMGAGSVGVWLVSGPLNDPGMFLSVNGEAEQFSLFPRLRNRASMSDRGAREAERCVGRR